MAPTFSAAAVAAGGASLVAERNASLANCLGVQQMTKAQQRGRIGHALSPQIDTTEFAKSGDVVQGVLASLIGQVEPVGDQVHAQHPLKPHRRSAVSCTRIIWLDQRAELAPWNQRFHTRQKDRK